MLYEGADDQIWGSIQTDKRLLYDIKRNVK